MTARADLRLAPVAVTVWAVCWLCLRVPGAAAWVTAVLVTVAVIALVAAASGVRRPVVAAIWLPAGVGAAAAVVAGAAAVRMAGGVLGQLAAHQAAADVVVVLTADPRRGVGAASPSGARRAYVTAPATAVGLHTGAGTWRLRAPVLLVAGDDAAWRGLLPGQRLSVSGRLRPPRPGDSVGAVVMVRGPPELVGRPGVVQRAAGRLRAGLQRASDVLPVPERGLLPALVDGDTSRLDPGLVTDFRTAGLTHLTAVSGANIAIIFAVVLAAARRVRLPARTAAALAAAALAGFVVLARPSPSVLRAAAMAAITLVGLLTGRARSAVPALFASVIGLLLFDPTLAQAAGFALSVLATAGLLLLAPPLTTVFARRLPPRLAGVLGVAVGAQVACAPLIVALWGQFSLAAVPANVLAEPAVPLATVAGALATVVAPAWGGGARALAWLGGWPTRWLVGVAHHCAALPAAMVLVRPGLVTGAIAAALSLAVVLCVRSRGVRRATLAASLAASGVWWGAGAVAATWPPPGWLFVACDVGQGDGLVVRAGPGSALVVDTGPDPAPMDACLRRLGVSGVPVLLLSHLHADHAEGLPGVLGGRAVGEVLVGPLDEPPVEAARVAGWTRAAGVPERRVVIGGHYQVGEAAVDVLAPRVVLHGTDSDPNNDSVVVRVSVSGVTLLLTGDVEVEAQQALLESGVPLRADVLKVPHHGSARQDPDFLAAVRARVGVVSVGAGNSYGQPAAATMAALRSDGMRAFRTDLDGDVAVVGGTGRPLGVVTRGHPALVVSAPVVGPLAGAAGAAELGDGLAGRAPAGCRSMPGWPPGASRAQAVARGPPMSVRRAMLVGMAVAAEQASVLVVRGDDEFLVSREISAVIASVRAADAGVDVRDLAGADLDLAVLDEALAPSLFADRRVVVVRGAHECTKEAQAALLAYAEAPLPETLLVVAHPGGSKGKALAEGLAARGMVVECPTIKWPSDREKFVVDEARTAGGRIERAAAAALIAAVGNDLRELATAVSQLVADTGGPIDEVTVARYYRGKAEATGFVIADRVVEGDLAGALELLRWSLGVGVAPVLVTSALAGALRMIARVATARQGGAGADAVARQLGVPAWKVKKPLQQLGGWRPEGLAVAVQAVARADAEVKGGGDDAAYALERVLLDVAAARGR